MVTAGMVKRRNNIPSYVDDKEIHLCIGAAKAFAEYAGVPVYKHNALYDLFICDLAGCYFENRALSVNDKNTRDAINGFVLALRKENGDV